MSKHPPRIPIVAGKQYQKNKPGHALKGIAGMIGTTILSIGIHKGIQAIRKGVTKRRKMKFGDEGAGRGPEARAIRREIRGVTGSWLHKKNKA